MRLYLFSSFQATDYFLSPSLSPQLCVALISYKPWTPTGKPCGNETLNDMSNSQKDSVRAALLWVMLCINPPDEESIPSIETVRGEV